MAKKSKKGKKRAASKTIVEKAAVEAQGVGKLSWPKGPRAWVWIGGGFGTAVLIAILSIIAIMGAGPTSATILVPDDPLVKASWEPQLKKIAKAAGLRSVSLSAISSPIALAERLSAKGGNTLFAELPLDGAFESLAEAGALSEIPADITSRLRPFKAVDDVIREKASGKNRALPFCLEPYVFVKLKDARKVKRGAPLIALAGKEDEDALAFYSLATKKEPGDPLAYLSLLLRKKTLQRSPATWNSSDALERLLSGQSRTLFLPLSSLRAVPPSTSLLLEIADYPEPMLTAERAIAASATVIVVPARSSLPKARIKRALAAITEPSFNFSVADARSWMPARIDTVVRDVKADKIRQMASEAGSFAIPNLSYSSENERDALLEIVKIKLMTVK